MATVETLITAEEYGQMSDDDRTPSELVRGRIVEMSPPNSRHGYVCSNTCYHLNQFVRGRDLGRVLTNDSGIVTRRNPDSLRGMDVAFISFERFPRGPVPETSLKVAPEIVFEVRSPSDRWADIQEKVAEYLAAGVLVVCVLDPKSERAHLFYPDQPPRTLGPDDDLTFPEILADFRVVVRQFFE